MPQVMDDAQKCVEYIRMRPETFQDLLDQCTEDLKKQSMNFHKPILAVERLIVTLRYVQSIWLFVLVLYEWREREREREIDRERERERWIDR